MSRFTFTVKAAKSAAVSIADRYKAPLKAYKIGEIVDPYDFRKLPYGTILELRHTKYANGRGALKVMQDGYYLSKARGSGFMKNPMSPQQVQALMSGGYGDARLQTWGNKANKEFKAPTPLVPTAPIPTANAVDPKLLASRLLSMVLNNLSDDEVEVMLKPFRLSPADQENVRVAFFDMRQQVLKTFRR